MKKQLTYIFIFTLLSASLHATLPKKHKDKAHYFANAQTALHAKIEAIRKGFKAKNIILFIGDGMGISTITAARILDGQNKGHTGEENMLSFDKFPFVGLSKTYNTNSQTPDSAGTMSAIMTGEKTKKGILSISDEALRADCKSAKGNELTTALELAERHGLATGVVTTTRLTHATPAATYAHSPDRDWENDSKLTAEAKQNGCKDIAVQFLEFDYGDGIDVAFGGGRREFMPSNVKVEGKKGKRTDGRDLRVEWMKKYPQATYIESLDGFENIPKKTTKVLGLFNSSHMHFEQDRANDKQGEPSLTQMTQKAIEILSQNEKGFFLMVEAGRIDHAHHAGNAYNALHETIELSKAVAKADALTSDEDTLIIVTADHSHVFTMSGYPQRGNPILGKVRSTDEHGLAKTEDELALDKLPYTTLGYANGRGFKDLGDETDATKAKKEIHAGRIDLSHIDTTKAGFHQEAMIPLKNETHSGEDVPIYSKGPGAFLLTGTNEENIIYHVMEFVGDLKEEK